MTGRIIAFMATIPLLMILLWYYFEWDWIFVLNVYIVSLFVLFALNPIESVVDTVILFNLRGIQNVEYRQTVGGEVWMIGCCLWSMVFWAHLMWRFIQQLPSIQRIVPEYPTGIPRGMMTKTTMSLPTTYKLKK